MFLSTTLQTTETTDSRVISTAVLANIPRLGGRRHRCSFRRPNIPAAPFLMECLTEFYSTYDDTLIMWNAADLISRVINRLQGTGDRSWEVLGITIIPPQSIFPINSMDITRYFAAASNDSDKAYQENLFGRILNESYTFHFWNNITFALVPEPGSLAEKLINQYCLHCLDVL
ncbi:hypothetical protein KSP40_PGU002162 [Platanthera guangdongensis]|uniref:Alpha 1,4-glycosyltransferase domain-containing protein n=1 Tax=Platanthera guangdongensis TaxID=2320717 RepID=A0ABR2MWW0_9ASPA